MHSKIYITQKIPPRTNGPFRSTVCPFVINHSVSYLKRVSFHEINKVCYEQKNDEQKNRTGKSILISKFILTSILGCLCQSIENEPSLEKTRFCRLDFLHEFYRHNTSMFRGRLLFYRYLFFSSFFFRSQIFKLMPSFVGLKFTRSCQNGIDDTSRHVYYTERHISFGKTYV